MAEVEEDVLAKSRELLVQGLRLNHPYALYIEGRVRLRRMKVHEAMPLLLRAADQGSFYAMSKLSFTMWNGESFEGEVVTGDYREGGLMLYVVSRAGEASNQTKLGAAREIFSRMGKGEPNALEQDAIDLCREVLRRYPKYRQASQALSQYYLERFYASGRQERYLRSAMAHWMLHPDSGPSAYWLAMFASSEKAVTYDRAKAVILCERALERVVKGKRGQIAERLRKVEEKLTAEEKKQVQALREEGFPAHERFRREAFETLKKIGDVPAEVPFEEKKEEQLEIRHWGDRARFLWALWRGAGGGWGATALLAVEETAEERRRWVAEALIEGRKLGEAERAEVARVILREGEELRKLLEEEGDGGRKLLAAWEGLRETGLPVERAGLRVGWYLVKDDWAIEAQPLLTHLDEDGAAARAGLRAGDTVEYCEGVQMRGPESRNELVLLLRLWPGETPLRLSVKRHPREPFGDSRFPKKTQELLELTLP
ncbi:MAG: hypothetical protein ACQKBY_11685 [Verrucomicrobiales bacterium]